MAGVLELRAACSSATHVAEVDVGGGRVDPELDPQRPSLGELLGEPPAGSASTGPAQQRAQRRPSRRSIRSPGRHRGAMLDSRRRPVGARAPRRPALAHGAPLHEARQRRRGSPTSAASQLARGRRAGERSPQMAPARARARRATTAARAAPHARGGDARAGELPKSRPTEPGQAAAQEAADRARAARPRVLALVSWVFGIMMAVAQDLPALENRAQYEHAQNSVVYDRNGEQARDPDRQPAADPGRVRRDRADDEAGRGRDRGPALLRAPRHRLPRASAAPLIQDVLSRLGRAGRLDDHPAVRQERARGPGQPHGAPEAARGGARLPPRAPVVEGQDPHRVPELDLLRRGRLRDRGGRPDLLRLQTTPAAASDEADRCASQLLPPGGGAARRDDLLAERLLAAQPTPRTRLERRNLVLQKMVEQGYVTEEEYDDYSTQSDPARRRARSSPRRRTPRPPTSPPGCASRSSTATAPARRSAAACRSQSTLDLELQRAVEGDRLEPPRRDRADRVGGRDRQRHRRRPGDGRRPRLREGARSTSPPTATASPGSSFKPFTLDHRARGRAARPSEVFTSAPQEIPFKAQDRGEERRARRSSPRSSRSTTTRTATSARPRSPTATTYSDNSVYAQLGTPGRPRQRRRRPRRSMGIETDLSTETEYSIDDGPVRALQPGADPRRPRDRRHAARDGPRLQHDRQRTAQRLRGTMAAERRRARSAIVEVTDGEDWRGSTDVPDQTGASGENEVVDRAGDRPGGRRRPRSTCSTTVVTSRHRRERRRPASSTWGKTGTTDDNGDAWFCGATEEITACVWVGHADTVTPMETEFARRAGRRRHLPGADLRRRRHRLRGARRRARGRPRTPTPRTTRPIGRADHRSRRTGDADHRAAPRRRRRRAGARPEAPAAPRRAGRAEPERRPPAAPSGGGIAPG